ncbi:Hemin transport system permease protein HmuU [Leucobacter aridicollis]|uniref:FecCD family ABC transporter permease n=1 Tax=Leucobacter aridicollis TaxID=283878 RepID=UPI002167FF84|nr:iron ABC transporter permease [Leucobacter aridicollis]MCS3427699.1 iron complex transport system permease protein [Leucobacter aridicollis]
MSRTRHPVMWTAIVGTLALGVSALLSLMLGIVRLSPGETLTALFAPGHAEMQAATVVWSIRLPRIAVAALVGAALAVVGTVMQAILRNPLAEPGITGVSAGAAVGAVAGITLGFSGTHQWGVPVAAFAGAAIVALILLGVLRSRRHLGPGTIILVGVSISALAGALINVLIANATDDSLVRSAMFWLAGDLELRSWDHVGLAVGPILIGLAYLATRVRALDALSLGEEIAATSGVNVTRERTVLLLVAALVTGAAVAVSGIISFVGLVVPHFLRLLVGASHARLLPLAALGGALFLIAADTVARTAFGAVVVQTGVVAALVGAPVFLAMLLRKSRA